MSYLVEYFNVALQLVNKKIKLRAFDESTILKEREVRREKILA
jgi:hypothetical protein